MSQENKNAQAFHFFMMPDFWKIVNGKICLLYTCNYLHKHRDIFPADNVYLCKPLWAKKKNPVNMNFGHSNPSCTVQRSWSQCCLKRVVCTPFSSNRMAGRKAAQRCCCLYWNDNNPATLLRWDVRVHLHTRHAINQYLEKVWEQFRDWAGHANRVWMMIVCSLSQVRASPVGIKQTSGSWLYSLKRQTGCQRSAFLGC